MQKKSMQNIHRVPLHTSSNSEASLHTLLQPRFRPLVPLPKDRLRASKLVAGFTLTFASKREHMSHPMGSGPAMVIAILPTL